MFNANKLRRAALVAVSLIGLAGFADSASAKTFLQNHPRRAEVAHRLDHQVARIEHKLTVGQISPMRANRLMRDVRAVRREERTMASHNHGRLTKPQQMALNAQLNAISRRIAR